MGSFLSTDRAVRGIHTSGQKAIKLKADVNIRRKGYELSKHKLEIGWRHLNGVLRFLEDFLVGGVRELDAL